MITMSKRKKHEEYSLNDALEMIENGSSIRKVSRTCNMSEATLRRRVKNGVPKKGSGRQAHLSKDDELQLCKYAEFMANTGHPCTIAWLTQTAGRIAQKRGTPFKNDTPSTGWWQKYRKRNPGLRVRTPSLIDPGRRTMSRASVMSSFFTDAEQFLRAQGLLNEPARIYNVDETWYCEKAEKMKKVVVPKENKMPYKVYGGRKDHTTLTMCVNAEGAWLPTMFTFKGSIPRDSSVHDLGPKDALYTESDSGHIDSELYIQYVKHIEPFLSRTRPVVIFQDNAGCHENLELMEFCVEKGVHLYNLPSKTTHLLQPLDKLFNTLKTKIEDVKHEAHIAQQKTVKKTQIPLVVRFAIDRMPAHMVKSAFQCTGICPLDISAIDDSLLVGDMPTETSAITENNDHAGPSEPENVLLEVFDETGKDLTVAEKKDQDSQTSPIESLPCSECVSRDVSVHPAIAAGVVNIDLASVLIPDASTIPSTSGTTKTNSKRKGRWLTHESEIQRMRDAQQAQNDHVELANARKNAREMKKQEKARELEALKAERQRERAQKKRERDALRNSKVGMMLKTGKCKTCKIKIPSAELSVCVLCDQRYHMTCMVSHFGSSASVCSECEIK